MSSKSSTHREKNASVSASDSVIRVTKAEVNLSKIGHNVSVIRALVQPGVRIMGVVKANAYGHGIIEVARYLQSLNVDMLGVAFPQEAINLRNAGITTPLLVFYGAREEEYPLYPAYDLEMTIPSIECLETVNNYLVSTGKKIKAHLKVDTGMGRVGIQSHDAHRAIQKIARMKHIEPVGLYSHLATSEGNDPKYVFLQLERFELVITDARKQGVEFKCIHLANSGGIIHYPQTYYSMVRPGIMLYGYAPGESVPDKLLLQQPLSLRSAITLIKDVRKGTSISYGRRYTTGSSTHIGTIPIGYADGFNRLLTNNADVLIQGKRFPQIGTVCMDQIMVDLGDESGIRVGDEVTLLGTSGEETITAWDIGRRIGTIPYEILCGLSARIPRLYV
jgi:alanine racemase